MPGIAIDLPDELLEEIARRAAAIVSEHQSPVSPWLDTKGAADYLACSPGRIHDLVQLAKLSPRRDGRRLLFNRADLDAYLEAER
jgi:excisionase family DNA binding protein